MHRKIPDILSNYFKNQTQVVLLILSNFFKNQTKVFLEILSNHSFFSNCLKNNTQKNPLYSFPLLQKQDTRVSNILSNYFKNKTYVIPEILSKTHRDFRNYTKKRNKGFPRFFQTTSKRRHKHEKWWSRISSKYFPITSKTIPNILSNYLLQKRIKSGPRDPSNYF